MGLRQTRRTACPQINGHQPTGHINRANQDFRVQLFDRWRTIILTVASALLTAYLWRLVPHSHLIFCASGTIERACFFLFRYRSEMLLQNGIIHYCLARSIP